MILAAARQAEGDSGARHREGPDRIASPSPPGSAGSGRCRSRTTYSRSAGPIGSPVLDPVHHPEHGRRLGLDRARHQGAAVSQCTACAASNMAIGESLGATSSAGRRDDRRRRRGAGHAPRDRGLLRPCVRCRAGTTTARLAAVRPGRGRLVMGEAGAVSCSRSSATRRRAREVYASSSATASHRTRSTSRSPTRPARTRRAMKMAFTTRGSTPPRSATSTRTGRRRRSDDANETR